MLQSILVFSTFLGLFYDPLQLYHTWNMQRKSNTECPLCKRSSFALLSFISFELLLIKLNPTKGSKGNFSFWYPEKYLEILKSKPVSSQSWGNLNNWHSKLRRTKEASAQLCKSFFWHEYYARFLSELVVKFHILRLITAWKNLERVVATYSSSPHQPLEKTMKMIMKKKMAYDNFRCRQQCGHI